ncbi:MAG: DUF4388 domain-containing protein [Desulfobacteraceae bacterium]|nr:DUF4388 domain-containing protein [Desulfobacteraceae bacterium]
MDANVTDKFTGTLDRIQIVDLLQAACFNELSTDIEVLSGAAAGTIKIRSGQVHAARAADLSGEEALTEILSWFSGFYQFVPDSDVIHQDIKKPWEQLLIDAIRRRILGDSGPSSGAFGFSGEIIQIDLTGLIQLACVSGTSRALEVETPGSTGRICFEGNGIIHAECGDLTGRDAFFELMLAHNGSFRSVPPQPDTPRSIEDTWEDLLVEARRLRASRDGSAEEGEKAAQTLLQKIQRMKVAEKIRQALLGDKETRTILLRDSNRMVQIAVIGNPKISDGEVALIAGSKQMDEEVLRKIANNREWMRMHQIRVALVSNPKCPFGIAGRLIETLGNLDWKRLATSKSVPAVVSQAAKRLLTKK